ncbi:Uncharacterised protein [Mycobacteroides abscessus subsp. abscessus]|nr:Uncharacterised protein [Mycobacteroides abscessus subsp. abscessus]
MQCLGVGILLHEQLVLFGERVDAIVRGVEVDLVPPGELLTDSSVRVASLFLGGALPIEFGAASSRLFVQLVFEFEFFLQRSDFRAHVSDEDVLGRTQLLTVVLDGEFRRILAETPVGDGLGVLDEVGS